MPASPVGVSCLPGEPSPSWGPGASASHVCGTQICIKAKGCDACGFLGGARAESHKIRSQRCVHTHTYILPKYSLPLEREHGGHCEGLDSIP